MTEGRYVVVSPVKDEAAYIQKTLESVARQTKRPFLWLIVDDGSSDGTQSIVKSFARIHNFIRLMESNSPGRRAPGSRVVQAFNRGCDSIRDVTCDYIVKLDCDLSFDADYFERLIRQFMADPKLGIASGVYSEPCGSDGWKEIKMPHYHAAGCSKMIRHTCFQEIGGFIPSRGWDTVDEIRAMARGWRTAHFSDLNMRHWKPEGSGIGPLRTSFMHGEVYYLTGGGCFFYCLKTLHRMRHSPFVVGGLAMFCGYARALLGRRKRLVSAEEARCYRALLNGRITGKLKSILQIG